MKSTTGACITLGVRFSAAWSKIQKLNSKSSTHDELIAVSDRMNTPLWLADLYIARDTLHCPYAWNRTICHV